jgi:hypothetical protein
MFSSDSGRRSRNEPLRYDKRRYQGRSCTQMMSGRVTDGRRLAPRDGERPYVLFSATLIAATVIFRG